MASRFRGTRGLGDYLNETFSLLPRIWKDALPVSIAAAAPAAVVFGLCFGSLRDLFEDLSENSNWPSENPMELLNAVGFFIIVLLAGSVLQFLGGTYQKAFICRRAGAELEGRKPRFFPLLKTVAGRPWLRVAVQDAVIGVVVNSISLLVFFAAMIPAAAAVVKAQSIVEDNPSALAVGYVWIILIVGVVASAALWFIQVRTSVSAPASVIEKCNSITGIGRSLHLSSKCFWRIFWAMFLVSLVISFGLGILTGPITFGLAAPGYFSFLQDSLTGSSPSMESMLKLLSSMGWAIGVNFFLSGIVQGILWPSFLTVLYADLRARKGENTDLGLDKPRPHGSRRRRIVEARIFNAAVYGGGR
jgi:hypothetical protein